MYSSMFGKRNGLTPRSKDDVEAREQRPHVVLGAPQRRRRGARGRRRRVGAEDLEQPADQALGRPVDEPDRAAGATHAHQLVGHDLVVRGELHAEHGEHAFERGVAERERLDVALEPVHVDLARAPAGDVKERRHEVETGHVGGDRCGSQRDVSGAGGDIEDGLGGVEAHRAQQVVGRDAVDVLGHVGIAARRPHCAVLLLETRGGGSTHGAHLPSRDLTNRVRNVD